MSTLRTDWDLCSGPSNFRLLLFIHIEIKRKPRRPVVSWWRQTHVGSDWTAWFFPLKAHGVTVPREAHQSLAV